MTRPLTRLVAVVVSFSLGGCYSVTHEERVRKIQISTSPQGALVWEKDALAPLGHAPLTLEKKFDATIRHFRKWLWFMPAVSAAGVGSGFGLYIASKEGSARRSGGVALGVVSFFASVATLLVCIIGHAEDHKIATATPATVTVVVQLPGKPRRQHAIDLNPRSGKDEITLLAMPSRTGKPPLPPLPPRSRVAVFDVEDLTGRLTGAELDQLTRYLAERVAAQALYTVPRDELRRAVVRAGAEGLRCYAGTCQQDAASLARASRVLATKVRRIDGRCVITATLYNTYVSVAEGSVSTRAECTGASLRQGMERLAAYLIVE
jgi:hypothetical protein